MTRFVYDTSVFVYALGAEHRYRDPCRRILELAREGHLLGAASTELVQEFVFVRTRRVGRAKAVADARAVAGVCRLSPLGEHELDVALALFQDVERLQMRDAIHAATALVMGAEAILSVDRDFDGVPGLHRVDPADAAAVARLAETSRG